MSITLGSNIASLRAIKRLNEASTEMGRTFERLSSGMRINGAADDAAGLAIAETLRSDRKIFAQGVRNLNDGISLLNVADGAIDSLSQIVVRLKELAAQAANGTYSAKQRGVLDKEAQSLSAEYTRIIRSTTFNDRRLLMSSMGQLTLQAGRGQYAQITAGLGGVVGNGTLGGATNYADAGQTTESIEFGDLNGDGILDMVTANYTDPAFSGRILVRMGTGGGQFGAAATYTAETYKSYAVALGDVNNDGILDLVSGGQCRYRVNYVISLDENVDS